MKTFLCNDIIPEFNAVDYVVNSKHRLSVIYQVTAGGSLPIEGKIPVVAVMLDVVIH